LNEDREALKWWIPIPKVKLSFEDCVLLDYLFREAAETPTLAASVSRLRQKVASLVADGGYSLADKESGAGAAFKKKPVLLHATPVNKTMGSEDTDHLKTIFQAIAEKTVCLVSYEAMSSGTVKTYRIHPLALFEHDGGLYLFVLVPYYGDIRILSTERIRTIDLTEEGFTAPENFDAEKRLSDPFGIILDNPFIARVRFSKEQAPYIKERSWPVDALIDEEDGGSIVLSLETGGAYELKRWVLSFGSDAELLEPTFLREEIAADLAATVARYAPSK
jgi:predicted DNA-binding transcriptional regulator YafY